MTKLEDGSIKKKLDYLECEHNTKTHLYKLGYYLDKWKCHDCGHIQIDNVKTGKVYLRHHGCCG